MCLSFWDITNLIDLEPDGGTYIYSSSEVYDEDQRFDHKRLINWLKHFGMKSVGGLPGGEKGPFYGSGRMDGPGMEWLIDTINAPEDPAGAIPRSWAGSSSAAGSPPSGEAREVGESTFVPL